MHETWATYTRRDGNEGKALLGEIQCVLDRQHVQGGFGDFVRGDGHLSVVFCHGHGAKRGRAWVKESANACTQITARSLHIDNLLEISLFK